MVFKATMSGDLLKDIIGATNAVVDDAIIHVTPAGINARAVDASSICLVAIDVKKEAFIEFEGGEHNLPIDIAKIAGMTGKLGKDDVTLMLDEASRQLQIKSKGLNYKAALLAPSAVKKEPNMPTFALPARLSMPGTEMKKGAAFVEYVAEHVRFGIAEGKFYMEGVGDTDSVRYEVENATFERSAEARSAFSLKYLNDMLKVIGKSEKVTVELGVDHPVRIITEMYDGKFSAVYMVAPRSDDGED